MNKKVSFKQRISYWFDNKMAQGFGAKIRLLIVITLIFIIIVGLLAAIAHGGFHKNFVSDFIRTFMYSLGKGGALSADDANVSVIYFILMLLTIIYCMFFSAILIGLINNALRTKVEDLGKGRSNVVESNHTLILGFNDATYVLLNELVEANRNKKKPQSIVILGSVDQKTMIEKIQKRIGWPKRNSKTRFICRTGTIYNFDDLKRSSIETSHSVIINADNDFDSVKAIMACSYIINETDYTTGTQPFLVSIIQNEENLTEAKLAAKGKSSETLITLALNEILARIMVHTSRQPGLSDVFTELFNFTLSEFYILTSDPVFPALYGKTIAEINQILQAGFAVGTRKGDSRIIIDSPNNNVFEEGDYLIVVAEDDDPLQISPAHTSNLTVSPIQPEQSKEIKVLVIGAEDVLEAALREYSNYLPSGSSICIIDDRDRFSSIVSNTTKQILSDCNINLSVKSFDPSKKKLINQLLDEYTPDCVLVLADEDSTDRNAEDERIMRTLIYLREFRSRSNHYFSITCEMLRSKNKELASATGSDDFIISRHFSALMMSQISQNKEMAPLFKELLSSYGFEIYMKPAHWYIQDVEPVNLFDLSKIVADRDEVLIGVRQIKDGKYQTAIINPIKINPESGLPIQYTFGVDDYLVVLSSSSQFPEYIN